MSYEKVGKKTARKLYNNGVTLHLLPSKVSVVALHTDGNYWVKPFSFSIFTDNRGFDIIVNEYEYYNCGNRELGTYASYYVEEKELESIKLCNIIC